jgi:hypothetical protein
MSAFTRLFYENRGLASHGIEEEFDLPGARALHDPPEPPAFPDDPYCTPEPVPRSNRRAPGPDRRRPEADRWQAHDTYRMRA